MPYITFETHRGYAELFLLLDEMINEEVDAEDRTQWRFPDEFLVLLELISTNDMGYWYTRELNSRYQQMTLDRIDEIRLQIVEAIDEEAKKHDK